MLKFWPLMDLVPFPLASVAACKCFLQLVKSHSILAWGFLLVPSAKGFLLSEILWSSSMHCSFDFSTDFQCLGQDCVGFIMILNSLSFSLFIFNPFFVSDYDCFQILPIFNSIHFVFLPCTPLAAKTRLKYDQSRSCVLKFYTFLLSSLLLLLMATAKNFYCLAFGSCLLANTELSGSDGGFLVILLSLKYDICAGAAGQSDGQLRVSLKLFLKSCIIMIVAFGMK